MSKKIITLALCALFSLVFAVAATGCSRDEETAQLDENNPISVFIHENRDILEEASQDHLEDLGPGSTVDFLAEDGEFIYAYSFGPGPTVDELKEYATEFLEYPSNISMYEELANNIAILAEVDSLTLSVRYYDGQGEFITSRSYESKLGLSD